jgi:hypothetical protein
MAKKTLEKLADKIIRLTPEEAQELGLIMRAKLMPQQAAMGQRPGGQMPMPTTRDAAVRGLLR